MTAAAAVRKTKPENGPPLKLVSPPNPAELTNEELAKVLGYTGTIPKKEDVASVLALGEGHRTKSIKEVPLTKTLARFLLVDCETFVAERRLKNKGVNDIIKAAYQGTFLPETVTLAYVWFDGKRIRVNGQHLCIARLFLPDDWNPKVRLIEYEAEMSEDLRRVYCGFDRGQARSRVEIVQSYLRGSEEFEGFRKTEIKLLAQGFAVWKWADPTNRTQQSGDEISRLLKGEYNKIAVRIGTFLNGCDDIPDHIWRAPPIGAMYDTFSKAAAASEEFWNAVAVGTGMSQADDPRLKLRNYLTKVKIGRSMYATKQKPKPENELVAAFQETVYRACIIAWNAWRDGKGVKNINPDVFVERPKAK